MSPQLEVVKSCKLIQNPAASKPTEEYLLLMAEIRRSPVEVGSLSHYLQGFIHPRWLAGFLPSTAYVGTNKKTQN